jgi:hypothetical protein
LQNQNDWLDAPGLIQFKKCGQGACGTLAGA